MDRTVIFLAGVFALMISSAAMNAQVGINTEHPRATLDVVASHTDGSTPEGIIIPRVDRLALNIADAAGKYTAAQEDAIVYVSEAHDGTQTGQEINVDDEGYYYFDGNVWVHFVSTDVRETEVINNVSAMTLGMPIVTTNAANYVAQDTDYVIVANGVALQTVTLPSAVGKKGKVYTVVNLNSGSGTPTVTISTINAEVIAFTGTGNPSLKLSSTFKLTPSTQVSATVQSDGTRWILLNTTAQVSSY